jgi:hypothetical protein
MGTTCFHLFIEGPGSTFGRSSEPKRLHDQGCNFRGQGRTALQATLLQHACLPNQLLA